MRLPRKGALIDVDQTCQMVDEFLEAGGTYFDTAHIYPGSEDATRKALVERHPRSSFTIATKLFPMVSLTANSAKKQLKTSLKRLGTNYVDHYLLHALNDLTYKRYDKLGLWDFVADQKAAGTIAHVGFSFHGGPEVLEVLLSAHPEVEFVQLQLNYADWDNPRVQSRANWEVARAHDVPIVVMEPVKGGALVKLPPDVKRIFDEADPQASYASWAIRFAASLDGVMCVLSGMSNTDQMRDNLSYMRNFQPLTSDEMRLVRAARDLLGKSNYVACTACGYCTKDCPQHIPIPELLDALNISRDGRTAHAQTSYDAAVERANAQGGGAASACIQCGACERVCTQKLPVIEHLEECARLFEA